MSLTGFDVKLPLQTAAVNVAVMRIAVIRRPRRDGHGSAKSGHPMTVLTAALMTVLTARL
jgi:hypothetical protein